MVHRFALMGCGGMGRRHLQGFGELARARPGLVELCQHPFSPAQDLGP